MSIEGLTPRAPVGAVLRVGKKTGPRGNPTETDRFFIASPSSENDIKAEHPGFTWFNQSQNLDSRRTIRGVLVHQSEADCYESGLSNYVSEKMHPNRLPFCSSKDSKTATRWMGGDADNFKTIDCPNDRCEFRQKRPSKPTPCKPMVRLLFHLRWSEGTSRALTDKGHPPPDEILCRFASGSWNTAANIEGFFDHIRNASKGLGLHGYSLFGFPFVLTLGRKTKPGERHSFPVVTMTPTIEPAPFFMQQRENLRELGGQVPQVEALTDQSQQDAVVVDSESLNVGIPAA